MNNDITTEKLIADLKTVVRDAEELLRATADDMGEKAREARERLNAALENARTTCQRLEQRTRAQFQATDELLRQHPYESIGIAFGVGLLFGVLLNRK